MRFLIDANMPRSIIALVASLGHEVEFARDVGLAAAPDHEIAARAQATGAALLTRDLDFADVRRYPPSLYPAGKNLIKSMVGVTGFEPATPTSRT